MTTNIRNKANEVAVWITKRGTPTPDEIRSYIKSRWPDLLLDIRENIAIIAMGLTF